MYDEYARFQGRLEKYGELIPFVYICEIDIRKLWFVPELWPRIGSWPSYEMCVSRVLGRLGLSGCRSERSLLPPGATLLPKCVLNAVEGILGTSIAHFEKIEE
ncbi:unnamed protein product [Clonostachys solani]|uniref:Uncharacterized protein n=1 Tax=Clonostachys solani TaxID=160281 RepID=A0A9N9Z2D8_9HYPO|nr:unnamed protein product [Clonostachys solani]